MDIDYELLRKDLNDYFGTASNFFPLAIVNVNIIEKASNDDLMNIALENGFNLEDYYKRTR